MNSVQEYLNYQEFLRDFYEEKKQQSFFFSYRYMADKTGVDAGFLVKVIHGKAHLSIKSSPAVAKFCGLDEKDTDYFEILVRYGRATAPRDIKLYFEKLLSLRGHTTRVLEHDQYAFYQQWYHSVIHALLCMAPFHGDYPLLARTLTPPITAKQARESIALLVRLGLAKKNSDGSVGPSHEFVSTGEKWRSTAVRQFQRDMLQLASESLERHEPSLRDISTVTITVSQGDMEEIRKRTAEFRKALLQMVTGQKTTDAVYQVNVQIFPVAVRQGAGQ